MRASWGIQTALRVAPTWGKALPLTLHSNVAQETPASSSRDLCCLDPKWGHSLVATSLGSASAPIRQKAGRQDLSKPRTSPLGLGVVLLETPSAYPGMGRTQSSMISEVNPISRDQNAELREAKLLGPRPHSSHCWVGVYIQGSLTPWKLSRGLPMKHPTTPSHNGGGTIQS